MLITIERSGSTAGIEMLGAELRSLRDPWGTEYIWQADTAYWGESAPWLFPVVCDLRNNQTEILGKTYNIERHGFARKLQYRVTDRSSDSVTLEAGADRQTLSMYPFDFVLRQTFTLVGDTLDILTAVRNAGPAEMLFCLGVHPGFRCPLFENERFEDYRVVFEEDEDLACPTLNGKMRLIEPDRINLRIRGRVLQLRHELFSNDALVLEHPRSRSVRLMNAWGDGIRVDFPDYESLGLWTMKTKEAPFLCIEPWNGTCDYTDEEGVFAKKRGVMRLLPDGVKTFHVGLTPLRKVAGNQHMPIENFTR